MNIDFDALATEDEDDDGKTAEMLLRERRMDALMVRALEWLNRPQPAPQVSVNPDIKVEQPSVVVQPATVQQQKPVPWTFEFERNEDGTIRRIKATPVL